VIFKGYIDESYDNTKKLFALSCLIARGKEWRAFERAWKLHLGAINRKLKKQSRPQISRYHASDCSGRRNEFKGWTHEERDAFVRGLFGIFKRIPVHVSAFDVDLDELCEVFPEWAGDRLETAYQVLTRLLMFTIGEDFYKMSRGKAIEQDKITLFHDRTANGTYDPTILEAFNWQMFGSEASGGGAFEYRSFFTTIAPLGWQDCIALQPADLVAFEVFKEAQAIMAGRDRRKSFDALMSLDTFGIHHRSFRKRAMLLFRNHIERAGVKIAISSGLTVPSQN
jgi:hypothetical protein